MYTQALLDELLIVPYTADDWISKIVEQGDGGVSQGVVFLFDHLWKKVRDGEEWKNLCDKDGAVLSGEGRKGSSRRIAKTHPKEICFWLKKAVDSKRNVLLPKGYFRTFRQWHEIEKLLNARDKANLEAEGKEAQQKRVGNTLYDHEIIELYESVLSDSVAETQRLQGKPPSARRKPIDTLSLGTIVAIYFAHRQRGLSIDDLKHGYLCVDRYKNHKVWDYTTPLTVQMVTGAKGDRVDGKKHLAAMMHHRDPMQCCIAMMGLYFAYQFFEMKDELPTLETWKSKMHDRPLVRLQNGDAACVTAFNDKLRQDLSLIDGANRHFTLHGIRNTGINNAGEDEKNQRASTMAGVGHSDGSHFNSYNGCMDGAWVLQGASYRGTDPEIQAAHVKALYDFIASGEGDELVTMLYKMHRPDLLDLELLASKDTTDAGERIRTWLHFVRHCILTWIVTCAAQPRNRYGLIDTTKDAKRYLVAPVFTYHLEALFTSELYHKLENLVETYQQAELNLGELALRGAAERRTRAQMTGLERRLTDLPDAFAACVDASASLAARMSACKEKAIECKALHEKFRDCMRSLPEDHEVNERYAIFDCHRREGDDDLTTLERKVFTDAEGDDELAERQTEWIRRYRELISEGYDGTGIVPKYAGMCDICIAEGVEAHQLCKHGGISRVPHARMGLPIAASSPKGQIQVVAQPPPPKVLATSIATSASATSTAETSPAARPTAPSESANALVPVPVVNETSRDEAPVTLSADDDREERERHAEARLSTWSITGKTIPHMIRIYRSAIAPLERMPCKRGDSYRATKAVGRQLMQSYSDLITKKYEPILGEVLRRIGDGVDVDNAAEALEAERGDVSIEQFSKLWPKPTDEERLRLQQLPPPVVETSPSVLPDAASAPVSVSAHTIGADAVANIPPLGDSAVRYIGLDPSLSCGWAILDVHADTLTSVFTGVIAVDDANSDIGARCLDLTRQLKPLLTPSPTRAFIEPFVGKGRTTDEISYALRAAIKMLFAELDIPYDEAPPQTWKKLVADSGRADKTEVQRALVRSFASPLPAKLPIGGQLQSFRDDASDAIGIGLWGVRQQHAALVIMTPLRVEAPGRVDSNSTRKRRRTGGKSAMQI